MVWLDVDIGVNQKWLQSNHHSLHLEASSFNPQNAFFVLKMQQFILVQLVSNWGDCQMPIHGGISICEA